jgi:putative oxidoreductase
MNRGLNPGLGLALLRIVLGVIFIAHGWPKIAGGAEGTAAFFANLGIPAPTLAAWAIALLETGGGLLLIVGFLVVPIAALLALHMLTGIFLVHIPNGFYVIGPGSGGYEFNLLLAAALLTLIFVGSGNWTLQDRLKKDIVTA